MLITAQADLANQFGEALGDAVSSIATFIPKFLSFLIILIVGYFIAKLLEKAINGILERVGFDRAVERGGIKKAMSKTKLDASDLLSKIVFYAVMLFVLQLAFGIFGENPISDLIEGVISYLPRLFAAILIVVVAAAVAAAVKEIVQASLGGLSYGKALAMASSLIIIGVGVFAALNQLRIAPAIVNGLFYAILAIIAGSAIVAIGGSGIQPLQSYWKKTLDKVDEESTKIKNEAEGSGDAIKARSQERKEQADPKQTQVSGSSQEATNPNA